MVYMPTWRFVLSCSFLAVVLAVLMLYCRLPPNDPALVRRLLFKDGKPIIIGHRAGAHDAPENTLLAIENAHANGATAVEIDVEFTKDYVPVLFHDEFVDKTTNGTGPLRSYLLKDLRLLNMAAKSGIVRERLKNERKVVFEGIPTVDEAMDLCMRLGLTVILDCKSNPDQTIEMLKSILKTHPSAPEYVLVTSFNLVTIFKARYYCPELAAGVIWRHHYLARDSSGNPLYGPGWTSILDIVDKLSEYLVHSSVLELLGVGAVSMHKDLVSRRYVESFLARGLSLITWTVNRLQEKEYFLCSLGVPIITDSLLDIPVCMRE